MKSIAVMQRELDAPSEKRDGLDVRWHHLLKTCGLVGVPVVNEPDLAVYQAEALNCGGLILTGGGEAASPLEAEPTRRQQTERALFAWAKEHGHPVLGVCRGMQFLMLSTGATLVEVDGHIATRHSLDDGRIVNSYHQYGFKEAPAEFIVTAQSGPIIEAVTHRTMPIAGLMWHPERESPFAEEDVIKLRALFCSGT